VPAYNEQDRIYAAVAAIVTAARAVGVTIEIIIVNDGSTDGTALEMKRIERDFSVVRCLNRTQNLGMGASFLEGVRAARYEKISLLPADNGTSIYSMQRVFENYNRADIVIGYFLNTEVRSRFRHFISILFNLTYCLTFNVHVKYLQGTPCFPAAPLKAMKLRTKAYSSLAEINIRLLRSGASFVEVDGYLNPDNGKKSGTIKISTLLGVIRDYCALVYDIYIGNQAQYSHGPVRVVPKL